jgi:hypothetical protein
MHEIAAEDLACPLEGLATKELSSRDGGSLLSQSFEISGCGKTEMLLIQERTGVQSQYSMPWTIYSDKQLRSSLQFTLREKCPTWTVEFIDDMTRGVSACGDKSAYALGLNGWAPK